jgi:imidazolonepropionase-like amidohydrolase
MRGIDMERGLFGDWLLERGPVVRLCAVVLVYLGVGAPASADAEPLAIVGGTIIDGNGGEPIRNGVIVINGTRISAVGAEGISIPQSARRIDADGKYIIPGLMDASVHLVYDISPEYMLRFEDQFEDIIKEGAQIALKNGITTIFETGGMLEQLKSVRDQINRGEVVGSRLFVAGNIVGVGGPLSASYHPTPVEGLSERTIDRINAMREQGVGQELIFMTPQEIRTRIREYIAKGIDFLKIAVSGQGVHGYGYLSFSEEGLRVMVEEARAAGLTVQTHTMTAGALRIAASGNYDLAQHCGTAYRQLPRDAKTLQLIPDELIQLVVDRKLSCTLHAYTTREVRRRIGDIEGTVDINSPLSVPTGDNRERIANTLVVHQNGKSLVDAGATILLSTDAGVPWIDSPVIHRTSPCWVTPDECLHFLGTGHMAWFKAMHEMGMSPMRMLQSATRNIAAAYDKLEDLGTIEAGKLADLVILDADPLVDFNNYRRIRLVLMEGKVIAHESLPVDKVLTPLNEPHLVRLQ